MSQDGFQPVKQVAMPKAGEQSITGVTSIRYCPFFFFFFFFFLIFFFEPLFLQVGTASVKSGEEIFLSIRMLFWRHWIWCCCNSNVVNAGFTIISGLSLQSLPFIKCPAIHICPFPPLPPNPSHLALTSTVHYICACCDDSAFSMMCLLTRVFVLSCLCSNEISFPYPIHVLTCDGSV